MTKKLFIKTYGCQMNVYDSDRMADALAPHGYEPTQDIGAADVVVINTGSFCPPFASYAVDVSPEQVVVRRVRHRRGFFELGRVVASFALAPTRDGAEGSAATVPELVPTP